MSNQKSVPLAQTQDRNTNQLQSQILQRLNTLVKLPILSGYILPGIDLSSGDNIVQHGLGRPLVGWFMVRVRSSATFFDKQDSNKTPQNTLLLNSSAGVTVDLYVF